MTVEAFVAEHQADWLALDDLVGRAGGRAERLGAAGVARLGTLYRMAAADLATARRRFPGDPVVERLEPVVGSARSLVYASPGRRLSARDWLTRGFWWRVREQPRALAAAIVLLLVPMAGAALWSHADPVRAARAAAVNDVTRQAADAPDRPADRNFTSGHSAALSSEVFTNNIRVAFLCFALGLTAGIGTAALLMFNGFTTGLLGGLVIALGRGDLFFRLVLPHGLLELSLIAVSGTAGLRIGWAIVHPGTRRRAEALGVEARAAAELALGCALLLVPCGLVEGFVTPLGLPLPAALAVGLGLAGSFWLGVAVLGRPPAAVRRGPPTGSRQPPVVVAGVRPWPAP